MRVKCRCGQLLAVSISTATIEETGKPKDVGSELCSCGREVRVLVSLYFPTPFKTVKS